MIGLLKLRRKGFIGLLNKMSHLYWEAKTRVYYRPQFAGIGKDSILRKPLFVSNPSGISIGSGTYIRDGARLEVVDRVGEEPAQIIIGDNVSIEQNVHISASDRIEIGNDVCLSAGVALIGSGHPVGLPGDGNRVLRIEPGAASIFIGSRVFIGIGATILPNVEIGDNSIIGAGSVVTTSVPANVIAAGVPARIIRTIPERVEIV